MGQASIAATAARAGLQRWSGDFGRATELGHEFEAIELRHHDVGDQQVRCSLARQPERVGAVADRLDLPVGREQSGQVSAQVGVVVGNQNARPRGVERATRQPRQARHRYRNAVPPVLVPRRQPAHRLLGEQVGDPGRGDHRLVDDLIGGKVLSPQRNGDGERRALADAAAQGDLAAVHFDQLLDEGQPDARALMAARVHGLDAVEALEDP